jgi:DnaK suppressor protein
VDSIRQGIYQDKLLRRKREIFNTLRRLDEENAEVTGRKQLDLIDQASNESEIRLLDQLSEGFSRELARIEVALGRILTGSYGLCLACHQPITKGRLDTFPEATFCPGCKGMREEFEQA